MKVLQGYFKRVSSKEKMEEDKYGNMAMLKKLREDYYCPCDGKALVFKDDDHQTLICEKC